MRRGDDVSGVGSGVGDDVSGVGSGEGSAEGSDDV